MIILPMVYMKKTLIIWMIVSLTNYPLGSTDCFFPNGTKWYGSISCHPLWLGETFFYGIPSLKRCKCSEAVYLSLRFPVFLFMIVHVFVLFLWSLWSLWSLTCCFFYAFWTLLVDVTADYVMPKGGQFHAVSNLTGSH